MHAGRTPPISGLSFGDRFQVLWATSWLFRVAFTVLLVCAVQIALCFT